MKTSLLFLAGICFISLCQSFTVEQWVASLECNNLFQETQRCIDVLFDTAPNTTAHNDAHDCIRADLQSDFNFSINGVAASGADNVMNLFEFIATIESDQKSLNGGYEFVSAQHIGNTKRVTIYLKNINDYTTATEDEPEHEFALSAITAVCESRSGGDWLLSSVTITDCESDSPFENMETCSLF